MRTPSPPAPLPQGGEGRVDLRVYPSLPVGGEGPGVRGSQYVIELTKCWTKVVE